MRNSELLSILLIFSVLSLLMFQVLAFRNFQKQLRQKDKMIQDLLNRLQSGDLRTYQTMTNLTTFSESSVPDNGIIKPMTDGEEIRRMMDIHGLGEPIFDDATDPDEIKGILTDLGVEQEYGAHPSN